MGKTKHPGIYSRELKPRDGSKAKKPRIVYDATASYGGKQRQSRGFEKLDAARDWQLQMVEQMRTGQYGRAPMRMNLSEYLTSDWWPYIESRLQSSESLRSYRAQMKHVTARLGDKRLVALNPRDVEGFKASMARDRVGGAMQNAAFDRLRQCLNDAVRWELISRNPCDKVYAPTEPPHEAPVLSNDGVSKLLAAAGDVTWMKSPKEDGPVITLGAFFYVVVMTGMRWGEMTKLQWSDIDFGAGVLTIPRANTKTNAGRRRIALGPSTLDRLQDHRLRQMAYFKDMGANPPYLVFTTSVGGRLTQANFANRYWYPLRLRLGLPEMHFHDLRHVHSTLLARAKVHPSVMQRRLGHADARTTLEIYTDLNPEDQSEAALAVEGLLLAKGGDPVT